MIFNKDSNGILEFKKLLGFIYKSVNFDNLISYIGFAERDIKKIIGKEVFETAEDHYHSDNYEIEPVIEDPPEGDPPEEDPPAEEEHPEYLVLDELVKKIQLVVALNAYRRYVPSLDLLHSDKGRQITVTEEEKPAFEWQIEKDNENLVSLANEAMDFLLEFLDEHIEDKTGEGDEAVLVIPWGESDAYNSSRELMIFKVDQLEKVFSIHGSRLIYLSLVPFMRRIQDNEIRSCFTEEKWAELKEEWMDDDISEENEVIVDLARQAMGLLALSTAIRRLSVQVLPDGLFTNLVTNVIKSKLSTSKIDRNEVSGYLEKDGLNQLKKLQEKLTKMTVVAAGETYAAKNPTDRIDPCQKCVRL